MRWSWLRSNLGKTIAGAVLIVAVCASASALMWFAFNPEVATFPQARGDFRRSDAILLDRRGRVIHELRVDPHGRRLDWTPLAEVSPALAEAVIRAEDKRFLRHGGADWLALAASLKDALLKGKVRGASTISMQLAAQLDPSLKSKGRRSLLQKWRQMKAARSLERTWTKQEILEAYLNLVHFRGELQGVAAASHGLFDKAPHGLNNTESAVLAVLVRSPNAKADQVVQRARRLAQLLELPTQASDGLAVEVERALSRRNRVRSSARGAPHAARRLFRSWDPHQGTTRLQSSLDADLQRQSQEILYQHLLLSERQNVRDGAILAVDNASGEVLVYIGGSGPLSSARFVDGVVALRQAGSTLKPFLYSLAFEQRLLTAASLMRDSPLELSVNGGIYRPQNYDRSFHGLVSVRIALASSMNIPAVNAVKLVGVESMLRRLDDLGFTNLLDADFYGPSIALGTADISLWELVNAYRTLANGGVRSPLRLTAVGDGPPPQRRRVVDEAAAFIISDILADRESRAATFGLESPLATRYWSAVKTGTSKDMRDNWCIGYSTLYSVGVWVGNFSGEPMWDVSGVTGAAPVWSEIMDLLHGQASGSPPGPPHPPPGVVSSTAEFVDRGIRRQEWFLRGTQPREIRAVTPQETAQRILSPLDGAIFAIDPDIPDGQQRLFFQRSQGAGEARWRLNGVVIEAQGDLVPWPPQPGRHLLQLIDSEGRPIDEARFQVRGSRRRTTEQGG